MSAADHLSEVQFFHVADERHRESIAEHGLRGTPDAHDPDANGGVWMWTDRTRAVGGDVWQVHSPPNVEHGSVASAEWSRADPVAVTFSHVPPQHLRRVQ